MKKPNLLMLIILLPALVAAQINRAENNPKQRTVTKHLETKIDSLFASVNSDLSPGCAVTVIENGKVIIKKSYGLASLEQKVPFNHRTVVRMPYSEAREFISVAAMLMEQDGILKIDDRARKYFPGLPNWSDSVTIRDLLNHRSGFIDEWSAMMLTQASMANRFDRSQFLNLLYNQPKPEIAPGKGYMYSNSDFGLLRLILEKASGKNLAEWLKQKVFAPLKMNSTRMQNNPLDVIANRALTYSKSFGDNKYLIETAQKTSPGGDYFILTSAEDLEHWAAAQNDETTEIAKAVRRLLDNGRIVPGKDSHYVFGQTYRNLNKQMVVFHEGVNGYNYLSRIPAKNLSVITFGNLAGEGFAAENRAIVEYLLNVPAPTQTRQIFLTNPVSISKDELSKYEGRYLWQNQITYESYLPGRKSSEFFVEGGKLKVRWQGNYIIELIPVGKDVFFHKEGDIGVQFEFTRTSPLAVEVKYDDGFPGVKMLREMNAAWTPSKKELTRFAGKYYSKHLDFYWTIQLNEEGKLVVKRPTIADSVIEPDGLNQFQFVIEKDNGSGFDGWILFHKDPKGNTTHFTVWHSRLMYHRFDRLEP